MERVSDLRGRWGILLATPFVFLAATPAAAGFADATADLTLIVGYNGPAGLLSFGPTPDEGIAGTGEGFVDGFGKWQADQNGRITLTDTSWKMQLFAEATAVSPPVSKARARRKAAQGVILSVYVDPDEFETAQRFSLDFSASFFGSASASGGSALATGDFSINAFFESTGNGLQFFPSVPLQASAPPNEFFSYSLYVGTFPIVLEPGYRFTVTLRRAEVGAMAAVPEPQTWAMMIMGFGLVGAAIRKRNQRTVCRQA